MKHFGLQKIFNIDGSPNKEVGFYIDDGTTQVFLTKKGMIYQFNKASESKQAASSRGYEGSIKSLRKFANSQLQIRTESFRGDMVFVSPNNSVTVISQGRSKDYFNDYRSNVMSIYSYSKIAYQNIYPGIDWEITIEGNNIKYEFVVAPGRDPSVIKMAFLHFDSLFLNKDGSFTMANRLGFVTDAAPVAFQGNSKIATRYNLQDKRSSPAGRNSVFTACSSKENSYI